MLKTITMDGTWQKIEIDRLWVDKTNMSSDITPEDNANRISDSYGQKRSGLCISADTLNTDNVFIAEWEDADPEDCIELWSWGYLTRPRADVKALNELYVTGAEWDKVYVQAL